jgi:signal transduction histidine kinase
MADIHIETDLRAESDLVMADSNQLRQVFLNLLLNAGDAINSVSPVENGRIYIQSEVRKENGSDVLSSGVLYLKFVDNGPGVPEEKINDVFDLFFTTKEPGKGTGLGLSVSYMIIDAIGGKIEVENNSGGGFCISVQVPLVKKEQQSPNSLE